MANASAAAAISDGRPGEHREDAVGREGRDECVQSADGEVAVLAEL